MKPSFFFMLAVFCWSTAFVGIRFALTDYAPGSIALFRFLIAGFCLLVPYTQNLRWPRVKLKDMSLLFLVGPVGTGVYSVLLNQSEIQIPTGIASFLVSLIPICSSVLALVWLKEKASVGFFIGLVISLMGLLLIVSENISNFEYTWALLLTMLAVACGSLQSISQKILLRSWAPLTVVTGGTWLTVLALSLYLPDLIRDLKAASVYTTLACLYLGVIPAFVAQWCWNYALSQTLLVEANSYLFTMPLITTLLAWFLLGEMPGSWGLVGGAITLIGALISARQWSVPTANPAYTDSPD